MIIFDRDGLIEHAANNDAEGAIDDLRDAIENVGMNLAEEKSSALLFTGSAANAGRAHDAVLRARHDANMRDIGTFYYVYPKGAQNVEFVPLRAIFGQ